MLYRDFMNAQLNYPAANMHGDRTLRVWNVRVRQDLHSRTLDRLGDLLGDAVEITRGEAFADLDRDLSLFQPKVVVRSRVVDDPKQLLIEVGYNLRGAIGDCEMMALLVP